jgi:putative heme-binding domain-containing protein
VLLARAERVLILVEAVKAGTVSRNEFNPTQVAFLRAHRNADVRALAATVFDLPVQTDRRMVVQRYLAALDLKGNRERGRTTYVARCASCHQAGQDGYALGPSVDTLKTATKEELLTHLIDPNRTVDPRYRLYQLEMADGSSLTGIIQHESHATVLLRQPSGRSHTLQRSSITRIQSLDQSMMPEGLDEGLSLQDMSDLLHFIVSVDGTR